MRTEHLLYGHVGSQERAAELARVEGVLWNPDLNDVIIVEPLGLLHLMKDGGCYADSDGVTIRPESGDEIALKFLRRWA